MRSTIVGSLIGIGMIVLVIVLGVRIFGGDKKPAAKPIDLPSYSNTDTVMRFTMDGPIVNNAEHEQVRITVGRDKVQFDHLKGYQNQIIDSRSYPNNTDSYAQFLQALSVAGYTKLDSKAPKDERGFCPSGKRYIYEAIGGNGGSQDIFRSWSTTCGGTKSFLGKIDTVRNLFIAQVLEYQELTAKTPF